MNQGGRKARGAWAALVLLAGGLLATTATAQTPQAERPDRPRLGVALSGGGAKGFAHIGVLRVLEEVGLPVDAVTGTSMGSVVGGLYAMGYTAEQLEAIVYEQDWGRMFSNAAPRRLQPVEERLREERFLLRLPLSRGRPRLPAGLIPGQNISMVLSRLTIPAHGVRDFATLPIPYACVVTDLETGEGVRLDHGHLPRAIRASIAIPTVFSPVVIDGRTYVDGGVARNLPAEDARALGADVVLCIDVSSPLDPADSLDTLLDVLNQAVSFRIAESTAYQRRHFCDLLIAPDVAGYSTFDFDEAAEIVRAGEDAARAELPRLRALADSLGRVPSPRGRPPPRGEAVRIDRVLVEGLNETLERQVRAALQLAVPARFTATDLDEAVQRVYSHPLFSRVTYQLESEEDGQGTVLVVDAVERDPQRLGVGLRFESHYRASILLDAVLRTIGRRALSVHLRLGEMLQLGTALAWPLAFEPHVGFEARARATRTPIDVFEGAERVSSVRTEVLEGGVRASLLLTNSVVASAGVGGELFNLNRSVGVTSFLEGARGLLTGSGRLFLDTFDQRAFPRRGHRLVARTGLAVPIHENVFAFHALHWEARWPLTHRLSLESRMGAGQAYGRGLPLHYRFFLGGAFAYDVFPDRQYPLMGFDVQELGGRSMEVLGLGAQLEVRDDVYATARWNAAYVSEVDRWSLDPDAFRGGVGLSLGLPTRIGPVEATLMSRSLKGPFELQVNVGHVF